MDLVPPLEDLHDLPVSQEFLRRQQSYCAPSPSAWTAAPQTVPVKTRCTSFFLSAATTQALQRTAKEEKSSITAMLHSLLAASLFHILPATYTTLNADCAVSLRRWLPSPIIPSSIGCFVGSFAQTYSRGPFSWSEARRTKSTIDHVVQSRGADMPAGFLRHVPDMHRWFGEKLGRQRLSAFELSDVGKLGPLKRQVDYRIGSLLFSQSASACSAAVKVSAVTGRDERLALGFSWQEGVVD